MSNPLKPISIKSLEKLLIKTTELVEQKIAEILPDSFGIVMDRWKSGTTHYLAVHATYMDEKLERKLCLLGLAPPPDEEEFNADSPIDLMKSALGNHGKTVQDLLFRQEIESDRIHIKNAFDHPTSFPTLNQGM
jgi:hypothetical protein